MAKKQEQTNEVVVKEPGVVAQIKQFVAEHPTMEQKELVDALVEEGFNRATVQTQVRRLLSMKDPNYELKRQIRMLVKSKGVAPVGSEALLTSLAQAFNSDMTMEEMLEVAFPTKKEVETQSIIKRFEQFNIADGEVPATAKNIKTIKFLNGEITIYQ